MLPFRKSILVSIINTINGTSSNDFKAQGGRIKTRLSAPMCDQPLSLDTCLKHRSDFKPRSHSRVLRTPAVPPLYNPLELSINGPSLVTNNSYKQTRNQAGTRC